MAAVGVYFEMYTCKFAFITGLTPLMLIIKVFPKSHTAVFQVEAAKVLQTKQDECQVNDLIILSGLQRALQHSYLAVCSP